MRKAMEAGVRAVDGVNGRPGSIKHNQVFGLVLLGDTSEVTGARTWKEKAGIWWEFSRKIGVGVKALPNNA